MVLLGNFKNFQAHLHIFMAQFNVPEYKNFNFNKILQKFLYFTKFCINRNFIKKEILKKKIV